MWRCSTWSGLGRLRDLATFIDPHRYAEGVEHVLVNGEFVVDGGAPTGGLPGVVITPREGRLPPATD